MGVPDEHPLDQPIVPWSPGPQEWPRLRARQLTVAALILVTAAASGWTLRAVTTGSALRPAAAPVAATLGPATVTTADGWVLDAPGTTIGDASAEFSPVPGLRAKAIVVFDAMQHPSLVPGELRAMLRDPLPAPRRARLAGAPAWTYAQRPLADGRLMKVTVAPTTRGVLAVACIATRNAWTAARDCATGIREVSLSGVAALVPGPDLALRARLPGVIERLDARRTDLRPRLARAGTRHGQARLAARLSRAYARAAAGLRPVAPERGASARVVRQLTRAARAHRRLAVATRARRPERHRVARRAVTASERALRHTLAGFGG
jgi:hypothetical protein